MRLIDADVAMNWIKQNEAFIDRYILKAIPTIDAVPVVRCRDCKYRFRNNGHDKNGCPITDADIWMDDDDFCSHGERKGGAE